MVYKVFALYMSFYNFMFPVVYSSLNSNWVWNPQCQTYACHHCGRVQTLQLVCGRVVVTLPRSEFLCVCFFFCVLLLLFSQCFRVTSTTLDAETNAQLISDFIFAN